MDTSASNPHHLQKKKEEKKKIYNCRWSVWFWGLCSWTLQWFAHEQHLEIQSATRLIIVQLGRCFVFGGWGWGEILAEGMSGLGIFVKFVYRKEQQIPRKYETLTVSTLAFEAFHLSLATFFKALRKTLFQSERKGAIGVRSWYWKRPALVSACLEATSLSTALFCTSKLETHRPKTRMGSPGGVLQPQRLYLWYGERRDQCVRGPRGGKSELNGAELFFFLHSFKTSESKGCMPLVGIGLMQREYVGEDSMQIISPNLFETKTVWSTENHPEQLGPARRMPCTCWVACSSFMRPSWVCTDTKLISLNRFGSRGSLAADRPGVALDPGLPVFGLNMIYHKTHLVGKKTHAQQVSRSPMGWFTSRKRRPWRRSPCHNVDIFESEDPQIDAITACSRYIVRR